MDKKELIQREILRNIDDRKLDKVLLTEEVSIFQDSEESVVGEVLNEMIEEGHLWEEGGPVVLCYSKEFIKTVI